MTKDYRKRAEELLKRVRRGKSLILGVEMTTSLINAIETCIQQVANEARKEENEACAKIADGYEINRVAFSMRDPSLEIKSKLNGKAISKAIRQRMEVKNG